MTAVRVVLDVELPGEVTVGQLRENLAAALEHLQGRLHELSLDPPPLRGVPTQAKIPGPAHEDQRG